MDVPFFAPEFKYMKKLQLRRDHIEQAKENAKKVNKAWVLGLMVHGSKKKFAVLDWDEFIYLYWRMLDARSDTI